MLTPSAPYCLNEAESTSDGLVFLSAGMAWDEGQCPLGAKGTKFCLIQITFSDFYPWYKIYLCQTNLTEVYEAVQNCAIHMLECQMKPQLSGRTESTSHLKCLQKALA